MKLADLLSRPLIEILNSGDLELRDFKPHTNDKGEVQCVELKFVPKEFFDCDPNAPVLPVPPAFRSSRKR